MTFYTNGLSSSSGKAGNLFYLISDLILSSIYSAVLLVRSSSIALVMNISSSLLLVIMILDF